MYNHYSYFTIIVKPMRRKATNNEIIIDIYFIILTRIVEIIQLALHSD